LDVIDYWFQSIIKSKYTVYARNTAFLIATAIRGVLLYMHAPLVTFAWAAFAEIVLGAIGLVIVYRVKGHTPLEWRGRLDRAKLFLRDCWPLAFASIAVTLYMRIGQVMVGDMLGNAANGAYSVALRLAEVWYFIPTALSASVFPALVKARKENLQNYQTRLQQLYDIMSAISISVAVITSMIANWAVRVLFGAQYAEAGPILSIYIWASVPVFLGVASSQYLVAEGYTRLSMVRTVIGAVINVLLNLLLIPRFGTIGAAMATLGAQVSSVFSIVLDRDTRGQFVSMVRSLNVIRAFSSIPGFIRGGD
jgi:PST family polysaccharide transporter